MRDIIKMVVVLTLIGAASGLTLSLIHRVTKKPIEDQIVKFVMEPSVKKVLSGYDNDPILDRRKRYVVFFFVTFRMNHKHPYFE